MDLAAVSGREAEVLAALGERLSNAEIARRLHISVRTVESHVSALLRKLDAVDRRALAALADDARMGEFAGLPASRTAFVGRVAETAAVRAALDESQLVTLIGPGGVGKTRLAAIAAAETSSMFPAGGAFVDLVPVEPGSVAGAIAAEVGVSEGPGRSLERAVIERLQVGRQLLVLDNCEHLVDDTSDVVERVLGECPRLTILATSRQRLGVSGEKLVRLHPLQSVDAERLFIERAGAVDAGFDASVDVIADLCSRLDGMPLAIELAAARAASLGVEGLLAGLDDQVRMLSGGRGGHPRHHSLRAVIGWSYDLLDAHERAMFRHLSAFVGTFDVAAAVALHPGTNVPEVVDVLGRLVDRSLVERVRAGRWRMLDTIRAFGSSQLKALGEAGATRERHRAWALAASTDLEARLGREGLDDAGLARYDEIADDLRAAAAEADHELVRTIAHLAFARGRFLDARAYYEAAAARAPGVDQAGRDLASAADAALVVADNLRAIDLMLRAAERGGPDIRAQAVIVGTRYGLDGNWLSAERRERLLADAAADPGDPRLTALLAMASAWHHGVRSIADLDLSRAALRAARVADDAVVVLTALDAVGGALIQAGSAREAHAVGAERLRIAESVPRHEPAAAAEITDAFHVASAAAIAAGDLPAALAIARRSRSVDPIGDHPYIWAPRLVRVLALTGDFDQAVEHASALWDGWQRDRRPDMPWMASAIAVAAMVHGLRADGQFELWRRRSLTVAGDSPGIAACLAFVDARVAIQQGRFDRADDLVEEAFATFAEPWWTGYARAAGAELAVAAGLADSDRRLGQAEPFVAENDWASACLARARGRLDDLDGLAEAVRRWERLGALHERAATLALIPHRAAEGIAALADLGCRVDATTPHDLPARTAGDRR